MRSSGSGIEKSPIGALMRASPIAQIDASLRGRRASPLQDLTVLITGAGRGIGRATALACAGAGGRVIALSRTRSDLDSLVADALGVTETVVP